MWREHLLLPLGVVLYKGNHQIVMMLFFLNVFVLHLLLQRQQVLLRLIAPFNGLLGLAHYLMDLTLKVVLLKHHLFFEILNVSVLLDLQSLAWPVLVKVNNALLLRNPLLDLLINQEILQIVL